MACQDGQLCAEIKAGTNGVIHGVQDLWDEKSTKEDCGFLLVYANNAFNNIDRVGMLWTVRHLCLSGPRFFFNFYHHWSSLVLRTRNGPGSFLQSKDGLTQGDPLATIAYGIGILPMI